MKGKNVKYFLKKYFFNKIKLIITEYLQNKIKIYILTNFKKYKIDFLKLILIIIPLI